MTALPGRPAPARPAEPGRVLAFAQDAASRTVLAEAVAGAAPESAVLPGGVAEAVERLAEDPDAGLLIVDLSGLADPLAAIDRLAETCRPGTAVVALGETNDVGLYRALLAAGIADYLTKPVAAETLRAAIAAARRQPAELAAEVPRPGRESEILAVVGARGGVGATMVATTLAWLHARERRQRTMLLDLDLTWGAAALALDVEPGHGLAEALDSPARIDGLFVASAAATVEDNLHVLAGEEPLDRPAAIRPGALARLAAELRRDFPRIVIDLPRARPDALAPGLAEADRIVIVTDLSLAGLRDTTRLLALARQTAPAAQTVVVANKAGGPRSGAVPRAQFESALGLRFAALVPHDAAAAAAALDGGRPLAKAAAGSKAMAALRELAEGLGDGPRPRSGGLLRRLIGSAALPGWA